MRNDGRRHDELRPIKIQRHFTRTPGGSVLWQQGNTIVWCTASITQELPPWFRETRPGGWLTAEYVMLPPSTPQRKGWPKAGHTDSRGTEIQRLIGRALRAAVDLSKIGPHTIALDCQVLQADGGTRTAAISAAYVALADAIGKLPRQMPGALRPSYSENAGIEPPVPARFDPLHYDPAHALINQIAAVSVGVLKDDVLLDLDYSEDSVASVDMNIACTATGKFVEVQGSAEEGGGFDLSQMSALTSLAVKGCQQILMVQREAFEKV